MAKIKLTKGELKNQRDGLKQFRRYLPTLQLKKQQLQMRILESKVLFKQQKAILDNKYENIEKWIQLLADPGVNLREWIVPIKIDVKMTNIAGASVPLFENVHFKQAEYDFYQMPFWVDSGIEQLRLLMGLFAELEVIKKRIELLEKELRTTTQRVNLFEKIKIPECLDNIRIIRIYLGDQQANAVGISKVAKKKVVEKELAAA